VAADRRRPRRGRTALAGEALVIEGATSAAYDRAGLLALREFAYLDVLERITAYAVPFAPTG
jgi:hypothetical protein